jgi:hypothetical protein
MGEPDDAGANGGDDERARAGPPGRRAAGTPLVATRARWVACSAALVCALVVAAAGGVAFAGLHRSLSSLAWPIALSAAAGSAVLFALLRSEESRLARELRVARTGTAVLRESTVRRRVRVPFVARVVSTQLGLAAVLLADGDRAAAIDALGSASALTRGGRLDGLRAIVDADLERATGTSVALARCVQRLRDMKSLGNREADLYRTHVLVKSILEHGDADAGLELVEPLSRSTDDDERIYATRLRVWFDLDDDDGGWPPLRDPEVRLALLLARAHGADRLVDKLGHVANPAKVDMKSSAKLLTIAPPDGQE